MRSRRLKAFKEQFDHLPPHVQEIARRKYALWVANPHHPSLRFKLIQSSRVETHPRYEVSITAQYRAVCFLDGDTYVWEFIGTHAEFDQRY